MEISNPCCCCLLRPPDKNLKIPYTHLGKTEIYANMLKECFEIRLTLLSSDGECGICEVCVSRLREASDFKLQVQRCQADLQAQLQGALHVKEEEDSVKPEVTDDFSQEELIINFSEEVKTEILVDPLPMAGDEEFKEFMLELETEASDICKQEPQFEVPINEQSTYFPYTRPDRHIIKEKLERDIKSKKNHTNIGCTNKKTCNTCGQQFLRETELRIHKRIHKKSKYTCEVCKKQFKWKSRLHVHTRVHTGEKPYGCDICNKRFSDKSSRNTHKRIHSSEKLFTCDVCKAQFKQKHSLISHMGVHTGLKHFRCKYCSIKFLDGNRLRKHVRSNHNRDICYSCDECKKVFQDRCDLVRHLNIHTKLKIYTCEICEMKLSTMGSLRRHKRIHTQERPYACELCTKQFRHKHGLNAHILIHTGEKPHCCEICGKQFAQKSNLKKHLEIHVEGQTYACQLCTKSYSTSEGLRQHRRTHMKNKAFKSVSKKQKHKETNIN